MFGIAASIFTKSKISNKKFARKFRHKKKFAFAKEICYFKSKARSKTRFQKLSARAGELRIFKEEQ